MEKEIISPAGKKLNWDDDIDLIPLGDSRDRLDVVYPTGDINTIDSRSAFTSRTISGITGANKKQLGWCRDIENDAIIVFIYTDSDDYIVRVYSDNTTNRISIGDWSFNPLYPILDAFIIGTGSDALLCFNDGLNPARAVNIANLIADGFHSVDYNEVDLLKPSCTEDIALSYDNTVDPTSTELSSSSQIRRHRFQFAISYIYDNGMESDVSQHTASVYDYRMEFMNGIFDRRNKSEFSKIQVLIPVPFDNIDYVKIFVKNVDIGSGVSGSWGLYDTWEVNSSLVSDGIYTYDFYNNKTKLAVDQTTFAALGDGFPITSRVMKPINNDRILLAGNNVYRSNYIPEIDISIVEVQRDLAWGFSKTDEIRYDNETNVSTLVWTCDLKGKTGDWLNWEFLIMKDNAGVIDAVEKYYYQYYTASTYLLRMSNVDVVTAIVADINTNTALDITASVVTSGGSPYLIQITQNSGTTFDYRFSALSSPALQKYLTWKNNCTVNLAICYRDKYGRGGRAQIKYLSSIAIPAGEPGNGWMDYYIQYGILDPPPSWAVCYQFMYGGCNISNYFSLPVMLGATNAEPIDAEYLAKYTVLDIDQAATRAYEGNEDVDLNVFTVQQGDRVRIVGYIDLTEVNGGSYIKYTYQYKSLSEKIDVEIQGLDEDGKLLLPPLSSFDEYTNFSTRQMYILEFYRTQNIDAENAFYYEIGDLIPISEDANGDLRHEATTVAGSGVTAVNQVIQTSIPAVGIINFGNTFKFTWHFYDRLKSVTGSPGIQLDSNVFPIIAPVESLSSSFMYDSENLPLGRANWVDTKQSNKTEESLMYSGLFRTGDLNYNELNKFTADPVFLESRFGLIKGVEQRGDSLLVLQQKKSNIIYLNRQETQLADGSTALVYSDAVLGTKNLLPYEIGCSHQGSIQKSLHNVYFFDLNTSAWYRFGQDGMNNITYNEQNPQAGAKMKAYGIYLAKIISAAIKAGNTIAISSGYDPVKDMYIFTYRNESNSSQNVTLAYHEPTNSWLSFYLFYHNIYIDFNENRFLSSLNGLLYEHHVSATKVTTGYYQFHFNKFPADRKILLSIEINADKVWPPSTEGDILIDDRSEAYHNTTTYEWFYAKMSSLLKAVHFDYYEGSWLATFLGNMLDKTGADVGKIGLENGERLRGKTASIKLRNPENTTNPLTSITIGYIKSL